MISLFHTSRRLISPLRRHVMMPMQHLSRNMSSEIDHENDERTTRVSDMTSAKRVMDILMSPELRSSFHACDTEVSNIDVKNQSPVGNGYVTCVSIYVGPEIDFGNGPNLFIDNLDEAAGLIDVFKPYFEEKSIKKVWHNYGFDRHVLYNHNINCIGFGGDTMHMARLHDAARIDRGYSLEALTTDYLGAKKISMKDIFTRNKVKKDGTAALGKELPSIDELQRDISTRDSFIEYACRDARLTWFLREYLHYELSKMTNCCTGTMWEDEIKNMWDFYYSYYRPFGEFLTEMERNGFYINTSWLKESEKLAEDDKERFEKSFLSWVKNKEPNAHYMNLASTAQKQQLFFAPYKSSKCDLPSDRVFQTLNTENYIEPGKKKPLKTVPFTISGLGLKPTEFTSTGQPQVSLTVLKGLAGDNLDGDKPQYGSAYHHFIKEDGKEKAIEACHAINNLCKVAATNTMLGTFIKPLQTNLDEHSRVHCSLNINTETGRLSARRPNLQNQPAVEKDTYKVREAFAAEPGNTLIVADYGQLELRVLAHMAQCKSMLEAFKLGGDFHSRTAMGMFPYVNEAVKNGEVILEWDYSLGEKPDKPLLKDIYGAERKRAKILNFSIAYGKTVRGLSLDFGVSPKQAQDMLDAWYNDRPEVKQLQNATIEFARKFGFTTTLMGRRRKLKDINSKNRAARFRAERAAINTPIQGGAADIVMAAMLNVSKNERLKELQWKCLLQIHDEIILEGPKESKEEAMSILLDCMEKPFKEPLLVDLTIDADSADTWYQAK